MNRLVEGIDFRSTPVSSQIEAILRCPACNSILVKQTDGLSCLSCSADYAKTESGSIDLRLKSSKSVSLHLSVGGDTELLDRYDALGPFPKLNNPEVPFTKSDIQKHIGEELLTHFSAANDREELALDLGCGSTVHKSLLEKCGYTYVGIDFNRPAAPFLADAHALPFADNSFSFIISIAVLEHLAFPLLAVREVARVLKPGARFLGTVAFIEPFHGNSYYHHTHRGIAHDLLTNDFEIEHLGYNEGWVAPFSLRKKFFPKIPRLGKALVWPVYAFSQFYWQMGRSKSNNPKLIHILKRDLAGSFAFSARKKR
jgi:SAM-dependent methyltransferase